MESAGALTAARPAIGLDARLTRQMSVGMKIYVRELTKRLPAVAPELTYVAFERGGNFGWDEQVRLPFSIASSRVALTHYMSLYAPLLSPAPSVITVHDLIHLRYPEYFKSKVGPYYRTVVRYACARARRVITDDEKTVEDLIRYLHVDAAKVRVVPLGVDERFFDPVTPYVAPSPYFLYVGNHRAHKNLRTLFDAWSRLPQRLAVDLYLTGPDDFDGALERLRTPVRKIVALGDVLPERLGPLYAGAVALVQPALREGFGLPVLEAMASGCAVVATEGALPHALSKAAVTFVDTDVEQLRVAMERFAVEPEYRARCAGEGRAAAAPLTWDRCARSTADVYEEALERPC
ncbi:MAG TPA: glycosyltransferase family 1 protein [Candidatus Tumulicola sp.]|jgi:alpha-1,3-rhamnosyl/mannosyltransferase